VASTLAVQRAMRWYAAELPSAKQPPVTAEELAALRAAMAGTQPWQSAHFEAAMTFGQAMYRLARLSPEVPGCNVGDVLTALAAAGVRAAGPPAWSFDPAVDAAAFAKLEFRETSQGIVTAQRQNREGWWAHGKKNRGFIEAAARQSAGKALAMVLGAGQAFDLPLLELARTFERLVLLDIDQAALDETVAAVFKDAGLRAKVEARVIDLTGINGAMVRALDEILDGPGSAAEVQERIERLCRSYRLPGLPALLPSGQRADLLVSSCVLTQLAWPQRVYAEQRFEKRFAPIKGEAEHRWVIAWREFELRVQQDHLNALSAAATGVALTSDVTSHPTAYDAGGVERLTGRKILALGVGSLLERVPASLQAGQHEAWEWGRYRPGRNGVEGSRMDVEGVVLEERATPSGLWVPEGGAIVPPSGA
jgi:hypothetical protein